ncbi:MAG: UDP-glucose 4-epimerase GalE [Gammaproteobacteria bacterium]|nr:UDP-glucose 4-epimerase GalE [Gammaproteobacteria bacterium]|tara:strand:+ start:58 stop:1080 length:1023 start_codon:yes stop_codon:yes gene_type:complete
MNVLLTGGAGYIGSHTAIALLESGHDIVIADNFCQSSKEVISRLEEISGHSIRHYEIDVADRSPLKEICMDEKIDAVMHFAGLKSVTKSLDEPLLYYEVNLSSILSLCDIMVELDIRNLVFSSSATVYGEPERIPLDEHCRTSKATNPYGSTKLFIEQILKDLQNAQPLMNIALLRYFNPAGAHGSARIGEDPEGVPNNLVPFVTQVAIGNLEELVVHGDDYDTADGTCVRDFIHVCDLAEGHVAALSKLTSAPGLVVYNLGTGRGQSVKEVIEAFEDISGIALNKRIGPRRPGDVPITFCDPSLAEQELGWRAKRTIVDICRDAWRWQQKNPKGYKSTA